MKPMLKRKWSLILLVSLCTGTIAPVYADVAPESDEIIYASIDEEGNLKDLYGVKVVEADGKNKYIQQTLTERPLPWHFTAAYKLDGIKLPPEALAGKSGNLEIELSIRQNPEANAFYYEHFGLQVTLGFPDQVVTQINAPGGSIVYNGNESQIRYTLLPGDETALVSTLKVQDFEMSPIVLTAIPLSITGELPDQKSLQKDLDDLNDGIDALVRGSVSLENGSKTFQSKLSALQNGSKQLEAASFELVKSSTLLKTGSKDLANGLSQIHNSLPTEENLTALKALSENNSLSIEKLNNQIVQYESAIKAMAAAGNTMEVEKLKAQMSETMKLKGLLEANQQVVVDQSARALNLSGAITKCLEGTLKLTAGLEKMNSALETFSHRITAFSSGIGQLIHGYKSLNEGSDHLHEGLVTLDSKVENSSDSLEDALGKLEQLGTSVEQTPSFIEESAQVKHLQFVMRTDGVEIPELPLENKKEEAPKSFFSKLISLFFPKTEGQK